MKKRQGKLVGDVVLEWKKMQGKTLLEKRINAYLTSRWIGRKEFPSDECIVLAQRITAIKKPTVEKVYQEINKSFGMGYTAESEKPVQMNYPGLEDLLTQSAKTIIALIQFS